MSKIGKFTRIIDVTPSNKASDYAKLYKSFLKVANYSKEISLEEAVEFVKLIASTRLYEIGLEEGRICLVDQMPNQTRGMFDVNSWQIFLPDTIFQRLFLCDGRHVGASRKIENTLDDIGTIIHELDHLQYEIYLHGKYSLGARKAFSKEEYKSYRLNELRKGIIKSKDRHFSSVQEIQDKKFGANFYHIKYGKYFTSSYETRARVSALEYVGNLFLNSKQFIKTHPLDAVVLGATFLSSDYNYKMGSLFKGIELGIRAKRVDENTEMAENLYKLEPSQPIIEAVANYQQTYFEELVPRETRIVELYSKILNNTATKEEEIECEDLIEDRELFENSFALIQNSTMAHQIVRFPGIDPALKATTLLYSNAEITKEEVETIYRDEKYYREHPEISFPPALTDTPESFTEYNMSEIINIRTSIYKEETLEE